jgi:HK97 family phage prohead protease
MIEYKTFPMTLKSVTDEGILDGALSVYNNVDYGRDVVRPGAFTKTLAERKGVIPMLWQHDPDFPIGVQLLSDTSVELQNRGILNLEKQLGREALSDVRMWQKYGLQFGQSIGYETVKENPLDNGVREILEANLWEGSLVTFGMNPLAGVRSVKQLARMAKSMNTELKEGRTLSAATRGRLTTILDELSTLLGTSEAKEEEAGAVDPQNEPDSPLVAQLKKLNSLFEVTI